MAAILKNEAYHDIAEIKTTLCAKNCIKIRLFVSTTAQNAKNSFVAAIFVNNGQDGRHFEK